MSAFSIKQWSFNPLYVVALVLFFIQVYFLPVYALPFDKEGFQSWCVYIFEHGIGTLYSKHYPQFNYPPLIAYPFYVFGKLLGSVQMIEEKFYLFKIFALFFDYLAALVVIVNLVPRKWQVLIFILLLSPPLFIYNSYSWGQVDAVLACLVFFTFWALLNRKFLVAMLLFVLAINFKVQAIIFYSPFIFIGGYQTLETS